MNGDLIMRNSILVHAPTSRLWEVLTLPAETWKYTGSHAVSDWQPGSTVVWEGVREGRRDITGKGRVVEIEPGSFLSYTLLDPGLQVPDIPENYLTITCKLKAADDATLLTVTRGDYSRIAKGEQRYREAEIEGGGWNSILVKMKEVAEGS
jgi:uncharacterized protein YndB with AHSA1/START domain